MMRIKQFTFNPFEENTYVLYDDSKECVIIDPGMYTEADRKMFEIFIKENGLKPVLLLNTHCHVDHVFGNGWVSEKYGLNLSAHKEEVAVLEMYPTVCQMYGLNHLPSVEITEFIDENDQIKFGNTELSILFTPGHSPGSLSFYHEESKQLIDGDVLFERSIGRTDLPGGDYDTLISSINKKLFTLNDEVKVYPGHGRSTSIGSEKMYNPFFN
ncbi:MAG TPA: MBL fold metallo-hydrolase [Saprospiraceae bacterium]|nr:MBL fold metallo-hydrolase [Saprospiraceae bacterium]HPK09171.1 MBL fold metallo-hydrolase [Saprospiraceae bacterium]HRX28015.1 MBL fold metallo-hydrolase [Saprospiraceae bacterium]